MAGPLQGILFLESEGRGWTESYWMAAPDYPTAITNLDALSGLRMGMSPNTVELKSLRVSDVTIKGDAVHVTPTTPAGTYAGADTADPDFAILVLETAGPPLRNVRYVRGVPIPILTFDPLTYVPGVTAFVSAFNAWSNNLLTLTKHCKRTAGPTFTLSAITAVQIERATLRKAGRPFGQRPGRRVRA